MAANQDTQRRLLEERDRVFDDAFPVDEPDDADMLWDELEWVDWFEDGEE